MTPADPLLQAVIGVEAARRAATEALVAAVETAFPKGSRVTSYHLSRRGCECEVVAHSPAWSYDAGSLCLRNVKTGKTHRASPTSPRMGKDFTTQVGWCVELISRPGADV